jgi:hypothetical protein
LDRKNWNFGNNLWWGFAESNHGCFLMIVRMLESENSWFLKKVRTELGLSGDLKRTSFWLKALRADWVENPKLLMRYDTANGCVSDSDSDAVLQNVEGENGNEKCWIKGWNFDDT